MINEIAKMPRGDILTTSASSVVLVEGLADYGVECAAVDLDDVANDAAFVEMLNEVRLRDQLLLLSARLDDPALIRARYNLAHCFSKLGGRAVLVAA